VSKASRCSAHVRLRQLDQSLTTVAFH